MRHKSLPAWVIQSARKVGVGMGAEKVLIFGSYARGTQTRHSDLDVFIVTETTDRPLVRIDKALALLGDAPCAVEAIVYTPEELRNVSSKFIEQVLSEGVVGYER